MLVNIAISERMVSFPIPLSMPAVKIGDTL
jgi:hypothetical protein